MIQSTGSENRPFFFQNLFENSLFPPNQLFWVPSSTISHDSVISFVKSMESVVATVSGYHGSERFNLIKLISHSGASYVGSMSNSTTHLVCWKFEGKKFELAKKFNTIVVNHRWVEDCIKQGKRLPEDPYMLQSGEEIGPLLMEVPVTAKEDALSKKSKRKVFSKRCNIYDNYGKETTDTYYEGSMASLWTKSSLLDENFFPVTGTSNKKFQKMKPKSARKTSNEEGCSTSRHCLQETALSGLIRKEDKRKVPKKEETDSHYSKLLAKEGRNVFNHSGGTSMAECSRRRRRLVKKNDNKYNLESDLSDFDQESYFPNVSRGGRNVNISNSGETSEYQLSLHGRIADDDIEEIEEIKAWNCVPASNGSILLQEEPSASQRASEDGDSDAEKIKGESQDMDEMQNVTSLPNSMELSCVICWTEFSSTRGVLPCGHRFCYSCIQQWADHMVSRRKTSTCPLCKATFVSITKVEDVATSDQKIYSQTIPCTSSTRDVFILPDYERSSFGAQGLSTPVCCTCHSREPVELLISCHLCQIRNIHSYCLDPPLFPWTCVHCKDLQMLRTF